MESELKDLNSQPATKPASHGGGGSSTMDDCPLLKPDPAPSVSAEELQELEKKCAAYVRCDAYGPMGRGDLSLKEMLLLGLALVTLVPIRVVVIVTLLVFYYLICRICTLGLSPNRDEDEQEDYAHMGGWRRAVIVWCGRSLSRVMLFVLGFYWITETYRIAEGKEESAEAEKPGAIISNHVSHLDILYHMSSSFPSFVAKKSVAKLPLVGLISKCLGCVYVQRESKSSDFKGVAGVVADRVREAHQNKSAPHIMLFPEGTTTNGDFLLPFKTGAFLAKAPVLPVILRYPYRRFSPAWDSISGVRHVIFLLCQFVNHIEVTRLPVYYPSQEEKDDAKLYANNVRKLMATEGGMTLSDIGLAEKRVYHAALNGVVADRVREAHQNKSAPHIMLFPEGTTTNGDFLLPFKTGAFLAKAPVLPVILRYPYRRFSPAWDSISGVRHVIFLLCQFVNHIEVTRLPVYYPSQEEKDDAKLYANNVRKLMASEGGMTLSDIGLAEKRVYHAALNGNNSQPSVLHQKDD